MRYTTFKVKRLTTIFYPAPFLTQQAANGKFWQAKINLAYKNRAEFYTKSFCLRKERDRLVTTRLKTQSENGIEFPSDKSLTS